MDIREKYRRQNKAGKADFHIHTDLCDGNCPPEEMAESALRHGLEVLGFSGHGYTPYDESYCMCGSTIKEYRNEVQHLAEKYRGSMEILCGIEQDCLAGKPAEAWDYVIGSVHYIRCGDEYVPIDETAEILTDAAGRYFGGDIYGLIGRYYETAAAVCEATGADIIGHFDLISKFNRGGEGGKSGALFDEGDPRYVESWKAAADRLIEADVPFEINTGAMSRGYRQEPYPSEPIREYIARRGGSFILSSDSHGTGTLCYRFDEYSGEL